MACATSPNSSMIASRAAATPETMPIVNRVTNNTHSKERTPSSSFHSFFKTFFIRISLYQEDGTYVWRQPTRRAPSALVVPQAPIFTMLQQSTYRAASFQGREKNHDSAASLDRARL
jgi:hypothetical protein